MAKSFSRNHPSRDPGAKSKTATDQFWLWGKHAVEAALNNPLRVKHKLIATRNALAELDKEFANSAQIEPPDKLDQLLPPQSVHQGLALLTSALPEIDLETLAEPDKERGPVVLLDQVTDPQNIGAILRSCAAFSARALIVTDRHAPQAQGTIAKAASGALESVPLIRVVNLAQAIDRLKTYGYWVVGLDGEAEKTCWQLKQEMVELPVAMVMGAEGKGLRSKTREHCDHFMRLPISESMESLNVSVAAAITLYEWSISR